MYLKKHLLLLFLFSGTLLPSLLAQPLPAISKEQMHEDYEYLVRSIQEVNPNLIFQKELIKLDVLDEIKPYKACIDTISSIYSFYYLVNKVLAECRDPHCSPAYIDPSLPFYEAGLNERNRELGKSRINPSEESARRVFTLYIVHEIEGRYYNFCTYGLIDMNGEEEEIDRKFRENKFDITLESGFEIIKIGEEPIQTFINRQYPPILQGLLSSMSIAVPRDSTLTVRNKGKIEQIEIGKYAVKISGGFFYNIDRAVTYFEKAKVLYINIPEMNQNDISYYEKEIGLYKNKKISKVIVDVRGNTGGNDRTWSSVLSMLVNEPMHTKNKMVYNNTPLVRSYVSLVKGEDTNTLPVEKIPFLENREYLVGIDISNPRVIVNTDVLPSKKRLRYKGKVYILQDGNCFSSTLALLAVANQYPNLITTVGFTNGYICGKGSTPFYFVLPHSKIAYRLTSSLDITACKKMEDIFKITQPQIKLNPTYEELKAYYNFSREVKKEEYLFHSDVVFKKVLELK